MEIGQGIAWMYVQGNNNLLLIASWVLEIELSIMCSAQCPYCLVLFMFDVFSFVELFAPYLH